MGKYTEIEETFEEMWIDLEHAKERVYLVRTLEEKDELSSMIHKVQEKVNDIIHQYQIFFANELEREEKEENGEGP